MVKAITRLFVHMENRVAVIFVAIQNIEILCGKHQVLKRGFLKPIIRARFCIFQEKRLSL